MRTKQFLIYLLLLIAFLVLISDTSSLAVTPPPPGDSSVVLKPTKWRIYTPWRSEVRSNLSGCGYNNDDPNKPECRYHVGAHRYALDFNPIEEGEDIYAISPGRVVYSKYGPSTLGNTIVIEHHGQEMIGDGGYYYSQYSHLSERYVFVNEEITTDDFNRPIGREGGTPNFYIHLHFELHRCEHQINPFTDANLNYVGCQSVIPEPMIGAQIYEGFSWLYRNAPREKQYYPEAWRPDNYNQDTTSPSGHWGIDASEGFINLGQMIVWDIYYDDLWSNIKEIRATIYFPDWPYPNPAVKQDIERRYPGLDPKQVWFIVASCNPNLHTECRNGHWRLEWNPWSGNQNQSLLPIGWLPNKTRVPLEPTWACISFDIFDQYGNASYAPDGTPCAILFANGIDQQDRSLATTNISNRLIKLIPQNSNTQMDQAIMLSQSLPDYSVLSAGQSAEQTWRIKNTGQTSWGSGYKLVFWEGDQMGAPRNVDLPSVAPGQTVDLSVNFQAPSDPKNYASHWRLRNPQGTYFGDSLWIKIKVTSGTPLHDITLFDVSPNSPSDAATVHIVGRVRYFSDFRSMRFRIGNQVIENPNLKQIGDQLEISTDWQTDSLPRGDYAIVFEVAKKGDLNWTSPERILKTYTLIGSPQPVNRTPDRPLLKSPYNWYFKDSSGSAAAVELCVHPVTDPDGDPVKYYFEVKDQGGGIYASSGWVDTPCWTRNFDPNTYSWKVKSGDGNADSDWSSDTWNFTVAKGGVYIGSYQIFQPNTNETHLCVFVTYDGIQGPEVYAWLNKAPDGSENGEWRLLDHYGPNAPPDCTQSNYHGFWIHSPEYESGVHKLRISAVKRDSGASAKIDTTYSIDYIRPSDVRLLQPSTRRNNGTWWSTRTIHFEWGESIRAEWYTLRVSTNSNPWADPYPLLEQTFPSGVTSFEYTFSQDYPKLFWSVRAGNSAGTTDSGPDVWFGIDTVQPTCQVMDLGNTSYESVFQVNWQGGDDSSGVYAHDIQYQDTQRTGWLDWLSNALSDKPYELFNGQPGHTYSFRCRTIDRAGNIGDYPDQVDNSIKIDPASRPQTAWWNMSYSYKRNLVVQNNMSTVALPAGYPLHLHFDNSTSPTAAELYNASQSQPKCNDLRIIYNDTLELDRMIDQCNESQIDIWFRSQQVISEGSIDTQSYQLYFGNPFAGYPPTNRNGVFYPIIDSNHLRVFDMREGSGFVLQDSTGNSSATMSPDLSWVRDGKFGPAVLIPGDLTPEPRPAIYAGFGPQPLCDFTAELWLKRLAGHQYGGQLIQQENGWTNPWRWAFMLDGDRLRLAVADTSPDGVVSNATLAAPTYFNDWHHVAVTYQCTGEVRFYIDGILDSVKYLSGGMVSAQAPLRIGSNAYDSGRLAGYIFGAAVSNIVRSEFPYGRFAAITNEPSVMAGQPQTPPQSGSPDLVVSNLMTSRDNRGNIILKAVIENRGVQETLNGFFTDLYINHLPSGAGDYTGSIQFWVNDPIAAGQMVTLTTYIEDYSILYNRSLASLSPTSEITSTLFAQADSTGSVPDEDRNNNITWSGAQICTAASDEFEDDDSKGSARFWDLLTSRQHNFAQAGDQDWIYFFAEAGKIYTFQTHEVGAKVDTTLYLYSQDGETLLAMNDDVGLSRSSRIEWTAPENGIYYLKITDWNPYTSGCGTLYEVSVSTFRIYLPLVLKPDLPLSYFTNGFWTRDREP